LSTKSGQKIFPANNYEHPISMCIADDKNECYHIVSPAYSVESNTHPISIFVNKKQAENLFLPA